MKKYTEKQEEYLSANYPSVSVSDLAAALGYTERSVITKLAKMGIYERQEYRTKRGEQPIRKSAIVATICTFLGVDYIPGLEKCDKDGLTQLYVALFGEKP